MIVGPNLDEDEFPPDGVFGFELDDFDDVDELVELFFDLLQGGFVGGDDHGDAGDPLVIGDADGEAVDVVAPAGKEPGNAGEHPEIVFDQE